MSQKRALGIIAFFLAAGVASSQQPATELPSLRLVSRAVRIEGLAGAISRNIEAPVVDQTHLDGLYDLDIEFSRAGPVVGDAPTVFEVIRKLGLRLDKAQIPVESIVVDHANFKPTEN